MSKLFKGTIWLVVAGLVVKVMAALYRVAYQNIAGDVGYYVYQQVYPILGVAVTISTYGFPVIMAQMLAKETTTMQRSELFLAARQLLFAGSWLTAVLAWLLAAPLGEWLKDSQLVPLFQASAFVFVFVPFLSMYRGLLVYREEAVRLSLSQMIEQAIRVGGILLALLWFASIDVYEAGYWAVVASLIGMLVALVVVKINNGQVDRGAYGGLVARQSSYKKAAVALFGTGLVICLNSMLPIAFQAVDALTLYPSLLEVFGEPIQAQQEKAYFDRGQPLLQLCTTVGVALSVALITKVGELLTTNKRIELRTLATKAIQWVFWIGSAAAAGLFWLIEPINVMLFGSNDGSVALAVFCVSTGFFLVVIVAVSLLQGIGKGSIAVAIVGAGLLVKTIGNVVFVPSIGILGASVATLIGIGVVAVILLVYLRKRQWIQWQSFRFFRVLIGLTAMCATLAVWERVMSPWHDRASAAFVAFGGVFIGALTYAICTYFILLHADERKGFRLFK
ncbi:polysaccharide biosynthesis protein [Aureibacillus halotolerans]|uniref:PST family polysaccharide transporter n=1 Tax=Aureibacillus halotolerans TaxID=1508390 RepID=A0A4R6TSR4_9BACI|nr:polysaccharide biosynthesis protein [Aureibacillus halotolerans]TDQ34223.1 PST family polysaccharide transporter [Aureibacillus halotolerans]